MMLLAVCVTRSHRRAVPFFWAVLQPVFSIVCSNSAVLDEQAFSIHSCKNSNLRAHPSVMRHGIERVYKLSNLVSQRAFIKIDLRQVNPDVCTQQ